MQSNVSDPLNLDKRKTCSGKYSTPVPSDSGMWTQLHEQIRAKMQSE